MLEMWLYFTVSLGRMPTVQSDYISRLLLYTPQLWFLSHSVIISHRLTLFILNIILHLFFSLRWKLAYINTRLFLRKPNYIMYSNNVLKETKKMCGVIQYYQRFSILVQEYPTGLNEFRLVLESKSSSSLKLLSWQAL